MCSKPVCRITLSVSIKAIFELNKNSVSTNFPRLNKNYCIVKLILAAVVNIDWYVSQEFAMEIQNVEMSRKFKIIFSNVGVLPNQNKGGTMFCY